MPKIAMIAASLAGLAAAWWFYGEDAGSGGDRAISAAALASEDSAAPTQITKQAEPEPKLQRAAELLAKAYQEVLEQERRRSMELEQELAARQNDQQLLTRERERTKELEEQLVARQNDQQLLARERERTKELEEQLAALKNDQQLLAQERTRVQELERQLTASRQAPPAQPAPPTPTPVASAEPLNAAPAYRPPDETTKPQPEVRRTGPRPLPKANQPMPRSSLQASDLTYRAGYWQVTATLTSNTSRTLDAQVQCSFLGAERSAGEASFGPMVVAPGEQISIDLIGPPTTARIESTTCRLVGQ